MKSYHVKEIIRVVMIESILTFIIFQLFHGDSSKLTDILSSLGFASALYIPIDYSVRNHIGLFGGFIVLAIFVFGVGFLCSISKYFSLPIIFYPAAKIVYHIVCIFKGRKGDGDDIIEVSE